ncbi:bile acid:sodium symporter family protein [Algoriphagus sediminis]|uniref:Bile acid:sodium symporter family protein n=1 Tax=Algoriphagus sediminis TaxID=3057113 RepID=A0ABT7YE31_9BACT|nr:bile acid:sodium symporter family protein [Algoriphagus sediminis]MDN3204786.1 bile acid:sodium symporter family protein [Algoriphagus sediminis]
MNKLLKLLQKVGFNGFLLGLFSAIFLAYLFPSAGSSDSEFPWKPIINIGIAIVFFLYGVKLDPKQLKEGLANWKLHLLIQSITFLLFPALVVLILRWIPWIDDDFKLGITYLSALPSTVSAAVVMVSMAGGNLPAAIFNASVSSLIGVFITPAWMGILGNGVEGAEIDMLPTVFELTYKVILPVCVGALLHGKIFPLIQTHLKKLKYIDQTVIMMIVFTTFSDSFSQRVFSPYKTATLFQVAFLMLALFLFIWMLISIISRILGFDLKDRITALFCGSKKSLVHGVVIGKILFPNPEVLSLVLLPVMLYHIQQLIIGSAIAQYFSRKTE